MTNKQRHCLKLLKENKLTQRQIAKILDVTEFTISRWKKKFEFNINVEWFEIDKGYWKCNGCNSYYYLNSVYDYKFCPHCGALISCFGHEQYRHMKTNSTDYQHCEEINRIKLGDKFKRLRCENNLTLRELAKILGTAYSTISRWETGKTCPDNSYIIKIAEYFGVSYDYLLKRNNDLTKDAKEEKEMTSKEREDFLKSSVLSPYVIGASYLQDWYINSIDNTIPPIWTEEHISELLNDFFVISKPLE